MTLKSIKHFCLGPPRDPFDKATRRNISLAALMAWIGLGADGLSSACYGPEEAFLALADHGELAIYLAIASAVTVFVISAAYMQVMELFPNGGGGYRVASNLLGPNFGLVSGGALVIDYVLTIAISVASGTDALFSLLPVQYSGYKLWLQVMVVFLLIFMNLRGMKESIRLLVPIFIGFMVTHAVVIIYGIVYHHEGISELIPKAVQDSKELSDSMGWFFVIALFLRAFSLGGGTYTGLEAVSNKVDALQEPKVRTGKLTMIFVASSLAFMAAGIMLLYLLWDAEKIAGQTLNASVFHKIVNRWHIGDFALGPVMLPLLMFFEAGLLLVAANTGFLAGPSTLANMARDRWMPDFFSSLSSRLVVKNGIILMGLSAITAILVTGGDVSVLVVLYSINVFITFSLSLAGLCRHWLRQKGADRRWFKLFVAAQGFVLCSFILIVTVFEKFATGGWMTMLVTSGVICMSAYIRRRYKRVEKVIDRIEEAQEVTLDGRSRRAKLLDYKKPTAALIVNDHFGSGIYTLKEVQKLFPDVFTNFVLIGVGEVDSTNFSEEQLWQTMRRNARQNSRRFEAYCTEQGVPATSYLGYGTDTLEKLSELAYSVAEDFPGVVFFGVKMVFDNEGFITQLLFNQTAYILQRRLNAAGHTMVILPMRVAT
jgi:amino acid transporter